MLARLWGDNFYDPIAKKWKKTEKGENGTTLKRGFVEFIMEPIIRLYKCVYGEQKQLVEKML